MYPVSNRAYIDTSSVTNFHKSLDALERSSRFF